MGQSRDLTQRRQEAKTQRRGSKRRKERSRWLTQMGDDFQPLSLGVFAPLRLCVDSRWGNWDYSHKWKKQFWDYSHMGHSRDLTQRRQEAKTQRRGSKRRKERSRWLTQMGDDFQPLSLGVFAPLRLCVDSRWGNWDYSHKWKKQFWDYSHRWTPVWGTTTTN